MGSPLQESVKPERGLCLSINLSFLRLTIMKNLRVITDVRKSVSLDEDNPRIISEMLGPKSMSTHSQQIHVKLVWWNPRRIHLDAYVTRRIFEIMLISQAQADPIAKGIDDHDSPESMRLFDAKSSR